MYGHIVIIGAGAIGSAIRQLLEPQDLLIDMWDKDETKVPDQKVLTDIVPNVEAIFLCVPSWALSSALNEIQPSLAKDTILVGISKGFVQQSGLRTDQTIAKTLPDNPFTVLSGPMLAREIHDEKRAYATIAALPSYRQAADYVAGLFTGTKLITDISSYPDAVALAGILKNVYTLLLGMADGFHYGLNVKGWLVARSIYEMRLIAHHLRLDQETVLGTAGLADFVATGFSFSSNNHRAGRELALHGHTDLKSEGLMSLDTLLKQIAPIKSQLPLLNVIEAVVAAPDQAIDVVGNLIAKG